MLDSTVLYDRFRGALIGAAVGDAVGTRARRAPASIQGSEPATEFTVSAITQLMMAVAESIVARRGFSGLHLASTLVTHYRSAPERGYSLQLAEVLESLERGVPWNQAGYRLFRGSGSFSGSPAARIAPVALYAFRQPDKRMRTARDVALLTHHNGLAVEGAMLQASAIRILLARDEQLPINRHDMLGSLKDLARQPQFTKRLEFIPTLLNDGTATEAREFIGTQDAAHEACMAALYAFMGNLSNFADAIASVVRLSNAPETAAMAGALSGTYLGFSGIPEHWASSIEYRDKLLALSDDLLMLAISETDSSRCVA